jgi:hypothetical protein
MYDEAWLPAASGGAGGFAAFWFLYWFSARGCI